MLTQLWRNTHSCFSNDSVIAYYELQIGWLLKLNGTFFTIFCKTKVIDKKVGWNIFSFYYEDQMVKFWRIQMFWKENNYFCQTNCCWNIWMLICVSFSFLKSSPFRPNGLVVCRKPNREKNCFSVLFSIFLLVCNLCPFGLGWYLGIVL